MEHLIHLNGYRAVPDEEGTLKLGTKDSYGIETLRIDADSAWDGLIISAIFVAGGTRTKAILKSDSTISVPPEATSVSTHTTLNRIVFTGEKHGVRRVTCDLMYEVCLNSGTEGDNSTAPTPSEFEQFVEQVEENANRAEAAANKIPDPTGLDDKVLTVQNGEYVIDDPLRIDDGAINREDVWSSKQVVDTFAPEFKVTGNPVTCDPVVNYPLSVTVKGKTTQEGSGDPTPENVRPLSGVGLKRVKAIIVGTEHWITDRVDDSIKDQYIRYAIPNVLPNATLTNQSAVCTKFGNPIGPGSFTAKYGPGAYIGDKTKPVDIVLEKSKYPTIDTWKAQLQEWNRQGDPFIIYYVPEDESEATGIYTWSSVENSNGSVYRGGGLELNGQLFDGDSVVNDVPSGFDKIVIFDGSDDEQWTEVSGKTGVFYSASALTSDYDGTGQARDTVGPYMSSYLVSGKPGQVYAGTKDREFYIGETDHRVCLCVKSIARVEDLKSMLAETPLFITYRSKSYTSSNNVSIQKEIHNNAEYVFDGSDKLPLFVNPKWTNAGDMYVVYCVPSHPTKGDAGNTKCDKLTKGRDIGTSTATEGWTVYTDSIYISIAKSRLTEQTLSGVKEWLKTNPIHIITPWATPVSYARPAVKLPAPEGTVTVKAENTCDVTGRQTAQAAYNQLLSMVTAMQTHITGV